MRKFSALLMSGVVALCVVGCSTTIPAKLEVRDVTTGRTYQTYENWGVVTKGVGYAFTDIETGSHINLTAYEIKTLEGQKNVDPNSVDAKEFSAAKARGGVK